MAIKAVIQILDTFALLGGMVTLQVWMKLVDDSADGVVEYGPVTLGQISETDIVSWAKTYMNDNWSAGIGGPAGYWIDGYEVTNESRYVIGPDTIVIVFGIGGAL